MRILKPTLPNNTIYRLFSSVLVTLQYIRDLNISTIYTIDLLDIPTGNSNYRINLAGLNALTIAGAKTFSSCCNKDSKAIPVDKVFRNNGLRGKKTDGQ